MKLHHSRTPLHKEGVEAPENGWKGGGGFGQKGGMVQRVELSPKGGGLQNIFKNINLLSLTCVV